MNTLKTVYIATIITGLFTGLFLSSHPRKISQELGTEN